MRLSEFLDNVGHPVAYYPALAEPLGGVNAAILFCQLYYWRVRASQELGVHKTAEEIRQETGLSRTEQENARKQLRKRGLLIETNRRLEHKMFYRLDLDVLERLLEERSTARAEENLSPPKEAALASAGNGHSGMRETCTPECRKPTFGKAGNPHSPRDETCAPESVKPAFVNGVKTTAEITAESSSKACTREPVDNFDAAAAVAENENPKLEHELTELLIALEAARRKRLLIDRDRYRAHVLAWVARGVTADHLREAHRRAVAARERDADGRAVNVGFLARFVDEVLAEACSASVRAGRAEWWLGGEADVCGEGARLGVRPKRAEESLPEYRVLVAKAAGRGPWIDHVLRDAQRSGSERFYRNVIDTFGDALLPADFYA